MLFYFHGDHKIERKQFGIFHDKLVYLIEFQTVRIVRHIIETSSRVLAVVIVAKFSKELLLKIGQIKQSETSIVKFCSKSSRKTSPVTFFVTSCAKFLFYHFIPFKIYTKFSKIGDK
ncbi:hypothetical protein BpHYR1_029957 [Brachionus plicatilis]|uniref:Uncharacterized protein n=1 Tax=Brachionus plicatilis TaxID=10195 RepID=A0A3M7P422_BRAPC|nr:hypothetical protein BpHYR1_029957 [Brachionus plicatilis]